MQQALWMPTVDCSRSSSARSATSEGWSSHSPSAGQWEQQLPTPPSHRLCSQPSPPRLSSVLCFCSTWRRRALSIMTTGDDFPSRGRMHRAPSQLWQAVLRSSVSLVKQESCGLTCGLRGGPVVAGMSMECMKKCAEQCSSWLRADLLACTKSPPIAQG